MLLIFSVFAVSFGVGCFQESYERHFVKKIRYLLPFIKSVLLILSLLLLRVFNIGCLQFTKSFSAFFKKL